MDPQKRETRRPELACPSRRTFVKGLAVGGVGGGLGLWRDTAWAQGMPRQATGVLSGTEFDRAYDMAQQEGHRKAVALFEAYAQGGDNPQLKQWAAKTLPHLKQHMSMAEKLKF